MERVLPPERLKALLGRLVFLYAHGTPKPDDVQLMLDTIRRTFAEERRLAVRAFVVADRDYRLDEELTAERKKLEGPAFRGQRWHIWQRAEIENYFLTRALSAGPWRGSWTSATPASLSSGRRRKKS